LNRQSRRKNDTGNNRGGIALRSFPQQTAAQYPGTPQGQPDEHEVKIYAVILNQGIQSIEYGIQQFSRIQVHGLPSAELTMARIAALSAAGSFAQAVTNLCQVGTRGDWISGVYSGVIVRIPL
jgi:hypothetical protein